MRSRNQRDSSPQSLKGGTRSPSIILMLGWLLLSPLVTRAEIRDTTWSYPIEIVFNSQVSLKDQLGEAKERARLAFDEKVAQTVVLSVTYRYISQVNSRYQDEFKRETIQIKCNSTTFRLIDMHGGEVLDESRLRFNDDTLKLEIIFKMQWDTGLLEKTIQEILEQFKNGDLIATSRIECEVQVDKGEVIRLTRGQQYQRRVSLDQVHTLNARQLVGGGSVWKDTTFTITRNDTVSKGGEFHINLPWWHDSTFALIERGDLQIGVQRFHIDAFEIMRHEVTNAEYKLFIEDSNHPAPKNEDEPTDIRNWQLLRPPDGSYNLPVVLVTRQDALAYCEWLSKCARGQYRLPTYLEWRYIAEIEASVRGITGWFATNSGGMSHPPGVLPASREGINDIFGNIVEWVADDYFSDYSLLPLDGSAYVSGFRDFPGVVVGGGWPFPKPAIIDSCRTPTLQNEKRHYIGFRVVREIK